jgi:sec-independent protein translocase protein TatA
MIGDLFDSPWKILIVAAVIIVLFGSAKLPAAARSLGKSMRILKTEIRDLHEDDAGSVPVPPAAVAQPLPVAPALGVPHGQQQIDELQRQLADLREQAGVRSAAERTQQPG